MAWNGSGWFASWYAVPLRSSALYGNLLADNLWVALFDNTPTPDPDPDIGTARYGVNPWTVGSEVSANANGWSAGGQRLRSIVISDLTDPIEVRTGDVTRSSGGGATMTAWGDIVYDKSSVALSNVAMCFHDYGGPVYCIAGVWTVQWPPGGVFAVVDCAVS